MKILQKPISGKHENAFFFNGVIARGKKNGKTYTLQSYPEGEICYSNEFYKGERIIDLGQAMFINDSDVEVEYDVTILEDKSFIIMDGEKIVDEENLTFYNYSEAIKEFEIFLDVL